MLARHNPPSAEMTQYHSGRTQWCTRRQEIIELARVVLLQLRESSPNHLTESEVIACLLLSNSHEPIIQHLRHLYLDISEDFLHLKNLSTSTRPSTKVDLVQPLPHVGTSQGKLLIVKSFNFGEETWRSPQAAPQKGESAKNELEILAQAKALSYKGVAQLVGVLLSPCSLHLISEYATYGDLAWLLDQQEIGAFPELTVQRWSAELIEATHWLHCHGWVHRDIKPSNILLRANKSLALSDFGSAAQLEYSGLVPPSKCATVVGTPDYIAPEVLIAAETASLDLPMQSYSAVVDYWSLGITLFELLTGVCPFYAESFTQTYDRIIEHEYFLPHVSHLLPSTASAQFLSYLICSQEYRLSYEQLKQHPWVVSQPWGSFASGCSEVPSDILVQPDTHQEAPMHETPHSNFSLHFSSPILAEGGSFLGQAHNFDSSPFTSPGRHEPTSSEPLFSKSQVVSLFCMPDGDEFQDKSTAPHPIHLFSPQHRAPLRELNGPQIGRGHPHILSTPGKSRQSLYEPQLSASSQQRSSSVRSFISARRASRESIAALEAMEDYAKIAGSRKSQASKNPELNDHHVHATSPCASKIERDRKKSSTPLKSSIKREQPSAQSSKFKPKMFRKWAALHPYFGSMK